MAEWTCSGGDETQVDTCDPVCGDGVIVGSEACDDGDSDDLDGCSSTCTIESGWNCVNSAANPNTT